MVDSDHEYDIAVSFSGEEREYVARVVQACRVHGLKVFYDLDETVRLWGTNVVPQLRRVYGGIAARYVVPFLSRAYLAGAYPMDELAAAMVTDVERGGGYILPVLMDDVEVPRELLNPAIIYVQAAGRTPEQIAGLIVDKVGIARSRNQEPREVTGVVESTVGSRLPRLTPTSFDPGAALDDALERIGLLFKERSGRFEQFGLTCSVRTTGDSLAVQVAERGQPVCELRVRHGNDILSRGKLVLSFAWPQVTGDGANGFVAAKWDADARQAKLDFDDFGFGGLGRERRGLLTPDELFDVLWNHLLDFLDRRG